MWSIETVDGYGEGQVETCHANGPGTVKDGSEAWIEGPRGRNTNRGWLKLEDVDNQVYMRG